MVMKINNFIEFHKLSKCPGSYRKGVVFKNDKICRLFINFTTSKMDKISKDSKTIFYAGRGKKDKDRYFSEDTTSNIENLKMKESKNNFPIYVHMNDGYYYLGDFKIVKTINKAQYNPNLDKKFSTIGFIMRKI